MGNVKTSTDERGGNEDIIDALNARIKEIARAEAVAVFEERQGGRADDDQPIPVPEAARLIGVSEWRVYEMIKRGALPAYRPSPRRLRLRLGAVREFIRHGEQQKPCSPSGRRF